MWMILAFCIVLHNAKLVLRVTDFASKVLLDRHGALLLEMVDLGILICIFCLEIADSHNFYHEIFIASLEEVKTQLLVVFGLLSEEHFK